MFKINNKKILTLSILTLMLFSGESFLNAGKYNGRSGKLKYRKYDEAAVEATRDNVGRDVLVGVPTELPSVESVLGARRVKDLSYLDQAAAVREEINRKDRAFGRIYGRFSDTEKGIALQRDAQARAEKSMILWDYVANHLDCTPAAEAIKHVYRAGMFREGLKTAPVLEILATKKRVRGEVVESAVADTTRAAAGLGTVRRTTERTFEE